VEELLPAHNNINKEEDGCADNIIFFGRLLFTSLMMMMNLSISVVVL